MTLPAAFNPLQPPDLEVTASLYVITESAYSTRTVREEIEATSVFETIPPGELGNPIETTDVSSSYSDDAAGEFQMISDTASATPAATAARTAVALTGYSSLELKLFSCHFSTDEIERALKPNETFPILGWNLDGDDITYFLIEDDPAQSHVWVQADVSVLLSAPDYKAIFPHATACRTWVIETTADARATAVTTAGTPIPLPQIRTATPLPPEPFEWVLTEEETAKLIAEDVPELKNPEVIFTPDEVRIRGTVEGSGPLGLRVNGGVEVVGTLRIDDTKKLVMDVTLVTLNGGDITREESGQSAARGINQWLRELLVKREIESFVLNEDVLTLSGVELHESVLPTPASTAEITPTGTATGAATTTPVLPQVCEVTFTPVVAPADEIIGEEATNETRTSLKDILNPEISFMANRMSIKGSFQPAGAAQSQEFVLEAGLQIVDERLVLLPLAYTPGGLEALVTADGTALLGSLNAWLPELTGGRRVVTVELTNGVLKINP